MCPLSHGLALLGGISEDNDCVRECWFYNVEKNILEKLEDLNSEIDWGELRGARGVSLGDGKSLYILSGTNTQKYKSI